MTTNLLINLFQQMYRIRAVEEEIANRYSEGKMRCPVHLSIGQEAIPAIFSQIVKNTDFAISTHRGHAHYLAKGGDLNAMIAEIYGKASGCSKGKGGSMHLIALSVNFMGTSAIVGNSIPVGVGLGLSAQLNQTDQISCVFLGDGAVEEGVFYESVNFAALRKLPVLFICENNLYSVYSPLKVRQPVGRNISTMVESMGMKVATAAGSDLLLCHKVMLEAFQYIREGNGPIFLEFSTYRWREHCGPSFDNNIGYRTEAEYLYWKNLDPLTNLEKLLSVSEPDALLKVQDIKSLIDNTILQVFYEAELAPFPNASEAFLNVYA